MMKKIIVICGPTATGKTRLAISLARKFNGEIISADSRQVYKGMDIGTGKDLPEKSKYVESELRVKNKRIGYFMVKGIKVWGYDLVSPKEEFSVSLYLKIAEKIINNIFSRKKLPILVGGTGLYIKALVTGIPTVTIPKDIRLRKLLEKKTTKELFENIAQLDSIKAANMNSSDRQNPRRLIRAIEVANWRIKHNQVKEIETVPKNEVLEIGLKAEKEFLNERIKKRINYRLNHGMENEVQSLIAKGVSWNNQSMDSLGYRQWKGYLLGKKTKEDVVKQWFSDEKKYAKRQMTWFKKDKSIIWFDVSKSKWEFGIENKVRNWYYKASDNDEKN